jgi:hypothetical protein
MIDTLQRIARAIQILRLPSLVVGLVGLALLIAIIFFLAPHQGDQWIIPCLTGLLWGMSIYAFIVTFRAIPDKPDPAQTVFKKLKQTIGRAWYGLIGLVFLGTTLAALLITVRMALIWLRAHGG